MLTQESKPVSNPATQVYITDLNEPATDATDGSIPVRSWWWRLRASLGWLPQKEATDRDLRLALRSEDADEVMRLLEAGVTPLKYPETPWLCLAARRGNRALLDLLVIHGAKVDQVDRETRGARGRTALHEAAKRGWEKGTRLLLEAGAHPSPEDDQKKTPLFLAVRRGHVNVARLLLEGGASLIGSGGQEQCLLHEATTGEMVDMLVLAGADVAGLDDRGFAPLHQQAKAGRAESIKRLVFHQADVNQKDRNHRTPVFWLGKGQANAAFQALVQAGADLAALDMDGNAPSHVLPLRTRDERLLSDLYMRSPLAWTLKNNQGETPLFILARTGRHDLAEKLKTDLLARQE